MKKCLTILLISALIAVQSCQSPDCKCEPPLISRLDGQWTWVKTVTPTRTITSGSANAPIDINFNDRDLANHITVFQADTLLYRLVSAPSGHEEDADSQSILLKLNPKGFVKIRFVGDQIETGEVLNAYTAESDTVKHFYQYTGAARAL